MNLNLIVLITKFNGADRVEYYILVALANFQFKVIAKVLADRLSSIAPRIISEQQSGFARGRHISVYICLASEVVNLLDYKSYGGNLALKFDIRKAFDTTDWKFLLKVLDAFGFDPKFSSWIKSIFVLG